MVVAQERRFSVRTAQILAAAATTPTGLSGSINLLAAASGGAMIDFDSTSGVAGVTRGFLSASLFGAVWVVATGPTTGAGAGSAEGAAGEAATGFCFAIAPV